MSLATIDWVLIVLYLVFSLGIALYFSKRAGKSLSEFFLGGRSLPWYIAGISMVATTFAADTPLAVTELVAQNGISANWLWWNMLIGGMLTTFFFARLWRRANILTEVEFITLRYSGAPARFLRHFKAVYLGLFMNVLVMGWVNLALVALLKEFFYLPESTAIWYTGAAMVLVALYSSIGGFMSVAITDMFQFVIAMAGSIVLAILVLNSEQIGGIEGLKEQLGPDSGVWNFFPEIGSLTESAGTLGITVGAFVAFIGFQWWASWYPGAEPGGGGYVAQRMMSARSERDSVFATLFFQIAHYCLRPWPWIIVALCTIVLYPDLPEGAERLGYVNAMRDFLPDGLRGLLLVAFLAAYMSTISTQLNWGASYLVNDLIRPLSRRKEGQENHARDVLYSRLVTVILMLVAFGLTWKLESISGVWAFMIECGAGLGMVLILRWFWWRINVWSEIVATVAPFVIYGFLKLVLPLMVEKDAAILESIGSFPGSYFVTIGFTTLAWLAATYLTPPEDAARLDAFYTRVRPGGWWAPVTARLGIRDLRSRTLPLVGAWLSAVVMTYSALFAMGKLIFGDYGDAGIWLLTGAVAGGLLVYLVRTFGLFDAEETKSS